MNLMIFFLKNTVFFLKPYFHRVKIFFAFVFVVYSIILLFLNFARIKPEQNANKTEFSIAQQTELMAEFIENENTEVAKYNGFFFRALHCSLIGYACDNEKIEDGGGLIGSIMKFVALPYANPISSGVAYVNQGLSNSGLIPKVEAWEGIGFSSLSGYMDIWKMFRNLSFLILTLFVIAIGFMLMFRASAGQAEIKIESALPRIVIVMVLISFSFAISGFLIDIMYACIAMSIGFFKDTGIINLIGGWGGQYDSGFYRYAESGFLDILPLGGRLLGSSFSVGSDLWNMIPSVITKIVAPLITLGAIITSKTGILPVEGFVSSFVDISILGTGLGGIPYFISNGIWLTLLLFLSNFLPGIILGIIIALTMLIFMFRMMFIFLEAYIKVLLYTIFSPILLLFGVLPGNGSIAWWMKSMIAELSVFPTFIVITLTSAAIIDANIRGWDSVGSLGYLWENGLLGSAPGSLNLPFISQGFRPASFNNVVSLGLLLMSPDLIKMVKGLFGVEGKGLNFSPALFFGSIAAMSGVMGGVNSLGTSIMGQNRWEETRGKIGQKMGRYGKALTAEVGDWTRTRANRTNTQKNANLQYQRNNSLGRTIVDAPGNIARQLAQHTVGRIPIVGSLVGKPGTTSAFAKIRKRATQIETKENQQMAEARNKHFMLQALGNQRVQLEQNLGPNIQRIDVSLPPSQEDNPEAAYDEIKDIMGITDDNYALLAAKNIDDILKEAINKNIWNNDPQYKATNRARIKKALDFAKLNKIRSEMGDQPIKTERPSTPPPTPSVKPPTP